MALMNENYLNLAGSYLFAEINRKVGAYLKSNPGADIIRLGIGDVTQPLAPAVVEAMVSASREMGSKDGFHGYGPEQGYEFLRSAIAEYDYRKRGIAVADDEIFVSDGSKSDIANFQELFSGDCSVAITDPVYPVYLDTNIMAGRSGVMNNGRYEKIVYLKCTAENGFIPAIPDCHVDMIYLCSPNNPTGTVLNREQLTRWVEYALAEKAVILFDSAYEAYIADADLPRSIYEIPGAEKVAVEFRSFSKTAGFTGTRCAYTVVPHTVMVSDGNGGLHELNQLWLRRQTTKFNGVPYVIQRAAAAVYSDEGRRQIKEQVAYYMENAAIIRNGLESMGWELYGGKNAPYIWLKLPEGELSMNFFDRLLTKAGVVGTPGVGFGPCGEGCFRLTAFGERNRTIEAIERIKLNM